MLSHRLPDGSCRFWCTTTRGVATPCERSCVHSYGTNMRVGPRCKTMLRMVKQKRFTCTTPNSRRLRRSGARRLRLTNRQPYTCKAQHTHAGTHNYYTYMYTWLKSHLEQDLKRSQLQQIGSVSLGLNVGRVDVHKIDPHGGQHVCVPRQRGRDVGTVGNQRWAGCYNNDNKAQRTWRTTEGKTHTAHTNNTTSNVGTEFCGQRRRSRHQYIMKTPGSLDIISLVNAPLSRAR